MEKNLSYMMSLQIKAFKEMLENFQEEQKAINNQDTKKIKKILSRRKMLAATIQHWSDRVAERIDNNEDAEKILRLNQQLKKYFLR